jgi:hypothetical protein
MSAVIRQMVLRKRAAKAEAVASFFRVEELLAKAKGKDGKDGEAGKSGAIPKHEWDGTRLRFQKPDGKWGEWVDLRGKRGPKGADGESGSSGGAAIAQSFPSGGVGGASIIPDYQVFQVSENSSVFFLRSEPVNGVAILSLNGVIQPQYTINGNRVQLHEMAIPGDELAVYWSVAQ